MPRPKSFLDSVSVLPCSLVQIAAISSLCSSKSAFHLKRKRARWTGGVALQAGNAAEAAFTAALTSSAVDSGALASSSPLAGVLTAGRGGPHHLTHGPIM